MRTHQSTITGGDITITEGDGFDSNGSASMTGGTLIIYGPTGNGNGAIDAGSFDVSGGTLLAGESAGMAGAYFLQPELHRRKRERCLRRCDRDH